jgi:hypothetical protein
MNPEPSRPKFRKREIVFAVAMGALAAGGAGAMWSAIDDSDNYVEHQEQFSGPTEKTYELTEFDEIQALGPQDVVITYGEELSVSSKGEPLALSLFKPRVENGRLILAPEDGFDWGSSWENLRGATFYVTMPKLEAVDLAGSGDISIDRVEGERFSGTVAGEGELSIAGLEVEEADFSISGSGNIVAAGNAARARVSIGGAGEVKAAALHSTNASITIGGFGDVDLTVAEEARISINGAGDVDISGPGRCSVTRYGIGEVTCQGGGGDERRGDD